MITILLNKLRLLTECMHAVSRYFNPLHTTLNGGGDYLVLICVMQEPMSLFVSRGNQKRRRQATYVSIRAEECDDIGAINRDTSEGERDHDAENEKVWPACNGGLVWRWEERGGVVMEVVCLCEMGGEGIVLLLSTCIVVMALLGVVALSGQRMYSTCPQLGERETCCL